MNKKHDYNDEMQDLIFTSAGDFIGMQEKKNITTAQQKVLDGHSLSLHCLW